MNLEDKLFLGALFSSGFCGGLLIYYTAKLAYHANQVKKETTNFLNSITSYFYTRVSKPEDIRLLADLAKYRKEKGI